MTARKGIVRKELRYQIVTATFPDFVFNVLIFNFLHRFSRQQITLTNVLLLKVLELWQEARLEGLIFYNSDAKGSLGVVFPSHHPRHPFLRLDELVPGRASRKLSERFAAVALDAVLGHQLLERGPDLRERHFVFF